MLFGFLTVRGRKKGSIAMQQLRHPMFPTDMPTPGIGPVPSGL